MNPICRISGPLMDRFDLRIDVTDVAWSDLDLPPTGETSAEVAARVQAARDVQARRFARGFPGQDWLRQNADADGRVIEEIVVRCEELCGKMRQHFMVDDLKFLRKGGRISGSAALAGTLLQIKPILQGDEEGKIVQLAKVRGKKAGM